MIKPWVTNLPWDIIKKVSDKMRVNYLLIAAMVSTESNGNTQATRFEPGYRWTQKKKQMEINAKRNLISYDTEKNLQSSSMGLLQIMGANAREAGHQGHLSELYKPEVGLHYGIQHLTKLIDKYDSIEDAISAYNQGTPRTNEYGVYDNQIYVDKVMEKYLYLKNML